MRSILVTPYNPAITLGHRNHWSHLPMETPHKEATVPGYSRLRSSKVERRDPTHP